jgi:hypothetical protein
MADIHKLRAFALAALEDWPEGAPDGFDLQDLGVKYGLLALKDPRPTEPCGEGCWCAEYFSSDEFSGGVDCYIRTPLLLGSSVTESVDSPLDFRSPLSVLIDEESEETKADLGVPETQNVSQEKRNG